MRNQGFREAQGRDLTRALLGSLTGPSPGAPSTRARGPEPGGLQSARGRICQRPSRGMWQIASLLFLTPAVADAGGFEFGANGTEALGRGGAFTAKADSPLALEYNVAGLARQRGTRLLFDSNLHFGSYSFQRAGVDSRGQPYGLVEDQAQKPFYAPFVGVSTDFGYFDRWTFAVGGFGPSSIGKRSYPAGDDGLGAARYDVVSTNTTVFLPTVAAAVRPSRFVDLGLALQLAHGSFELSSVSFVKGNATPDGPCRDRLEDPRCDNRTEVNVRSKVDVLVALGLLIHPTESVDIGLHVRSGANFGAKKITATGTLQAVTPNGTVLGPEDATFTADLPWIFRLGARYAFRRAGREAGDIEVNATYEAWSLSEGEGSRLQAPSPLNPNNLTLDVTLPHHYRDTYSLRVGGAFNQPAGPATLTLRAGLFFDSSATADTDTRLDFNTLPKLGATAGLGARIRGVTLNVAYAFIHSFPRDVADGRLRPIDASSGMPLVDSFGNPTPGVNNGRYEGRNHILSLGMQVRFDEMIRGHVRARP
jgi:long-subunit fatty acid transport protein